MLNPLIVEYFESCLFKRKTQKWKARIKNFFFKGGGVVREIFKFAGGGGVGIF